MPRKHKLVGTKLRKCEEVFVTLPHAHRRAPVWHALAKIAGVEEKRAVEHLRLALSVVGVGELENG